jgi:hypothetical protein
MAAENEQSPSPGNIWWSEDLLNRSKLLHRVLLPVLVDPSAPDPPEN